MSIHRRQLLDRAASAIFVSAVASLSPVRLLAASRPKPQPAALLLPLTGPAAALGVSMQRAATLAQPAGAGKDDLIVLDTGGVPEGAARAAALAIRRGARIILGPLSTAEVRPVLAAVGGRVPVIAFSNDASLIGSGAFVLGVTASQMVGAALRYARGRGVRRVALAGSGGAWSSQAFDAARRLQGELGLTLQPLPPTIAPENLPAALGGTLPDAVLAPDGASFVAIAQALRGSGVQLLGTLEALDYAPATLAAIEGAWLATPDPAGFADFARTYETRMGGAPGAIAALAYDAATIAGALRAAGPVTREALLASPGYKGVTGTIRFRDDGSCLRSLAILVAGRDGYTVADHSLSA